MSSALPALLRLISETISCDAAPASKTADLEAGLQPQGDFGLHVGKLLLEELGRGERPAELPALEAILAGAVPAILGGAHDTPGDAIACLVETFERRT